MLKEECMRDVEFNFIYELVPNLVKNKNSSQGLEEGGICFFVFFFCFH